MRTARSTVASLLGTTSSGCSRSPGTSAATASGTRSGARRRSRSRTPVARMLWLVWMPYRRLMAIFTGASAVPGSTAGMGALAAKVLAITVVGGAAVGVTAKEVADVQSFGQSKQARMRAAAAVI